MVMQQYNFWCVYVRSLWRTDFWIWDTQWARLRCPDENDGEVKGESEVPGGLLKL